MTNKKIKSKAKKVLESLFDENFIQNVSAILNSLSDIEIQHFKHLMVEDFKGILTRKSPEINPLTDYMIYLSVRKVLYSSIPENLPTIIFDAVSELSLKDKENVLEELLHFEIIEVFRKKLFDVKP